MICKINFGKWLGTHAAGELKNDSGKSRKFRLPHSTQKSQSTLSLWHFKGPSKKVGVVRSMACDVALEQVLHGQMCVCVCVCFLTFLTTISSNYDMSVLLLANHLQICN